MWDAPPGTKHAFIGDEMGRSGWVIGLPDGSETTVYRQLPSSVAMTEVILEDSPDDRPLDGLLRQWLEETESIYIAAVDKYSGDAALKLINRPNTCPFNAATIAALRAAIRDAGY